MHDAPSFRVKALALTSVHDSNITGSQEHAGRKRLETLSMKHIETEVKFYLPEIEPVRNIIIRMGAESTGRIFETNLRFEDAEKNLIQRQSLLRLRKDARTRLTFKAPSNDPDAEFKTLKELEVEVSDFATMRRILEALGFHAEQIYEKWRETFVFQAAILCLDAMPFGNFLEIEGEKTAIKDLADRLGLLWKKRITANYLAIFETIRQEFGLPFADPTFENFNNAGIDVARVMQRFEADAEPVAGRTADHRQ
ncbi:MAG: class IV adenylate cyclase [Desulfobacterales bacterium]|nr:class IV adenylate cyclase [Desulfobacterales bacterium]